MVDRYTKTVLTVIAVALVWLAAQQSIPSADAARLYLPPVLVAQISNDAARCIAGHLSSLRGDIGLCIASW